MGEQLLEEKRVPLSRLDDLHRADSGTLDAPSPSIRSSDSARSRLEQDRAGIRPARPPLWPLVEKVGTGEAEEEDRGLAYPVGDVFEQFEERWLRPVQIVDDDDERPLARELLEQPAKRPEGLASVREGIGQAEERRQRPGDLGILTSGVTDEGGDLPPRLLR